MEFERIKAILDQAITDWTQLNETPPDFTRHGATFSWETRDKLLAATGHGKRLIQPELIGNSQGDHTNLIIDLRTGINGLRMPFGGPFLAEGLIMEIQDWINAGCPE